MRITSQAIGLLRRGAFASAMLLAATTGTGCMSSNESRTCAIKGAEILNSGVSAAELCRGFEERLHAAIAGHMDLSGVSISLTIEESGTIQASIVKIEAGGAETLADVAVDVMDRSLNRGDLDRLADTAAQVIISNRVTA